MDEESDIKYKPNPAIWKGAASLGKIKRTCRQPDRYENTSITAIDLPKDGN